jgi:hypothetical protein
MATTLREGMPIRTGLFRIMGTLGRIRMKERHGRLS